jgi:hypothetical protein
VNATACPSVDGFGEELSDVVVAALLITWINAADVLDAYVASPLYTAVTLFVPAAKFELLHMAAPLVSGTAANVAVPDLNVTEPVGAPVPELGVTIAVN